MLIEVMQHVPQSYLWINIQISGHSTPVNYSKQFNETVDDFKKALQRGSRFRETKLNNNSYGKSCEAKMNTQINHR